MSRISLAGWRGPLGENPTEALPDAHSSKTPDLILEFGDEDHFIPETYLSFGYTNYQVWCIGAAGGRGGNAVTQAGFAFTKREVTLSTADWNRYKEYIRLTDGIGNTAGFDALYSWGDPQVGAPDGLYTAVQIMEYYNPQHKLTETTFSSATLVPYELHGGIHGGGRAGGGGGGGGLQIVEGLLVDLPESVPTTVGRPGQPGALGHNVRSGIWTPMPEPLNSNINPNDYPAGPVRRYWELANYFAALLNKYPIGVRTSFDNPGPGTDGGASAFGDICSASGGKAGEKAVIPVTNLPVLNGGRGGAGGIGGQTEAGGGAVGGTHSDTPTGGTWAWNSYDSYPVTPPGVGTWDGAIGQGGGGGQSGIAPIYHLFNAGQVINTPMDSQRGGDGSRNLEDLSVYGPGQPAFGDEQGGSGGGAHRSDKKFGSFAEGYLARAGILLRLYQEEP